MQQRNLAKSFKDTHSKNAPQNKTQIPKKNKMWIFG